MVVAPELGRERHAVADIEPEKEAAGRPVEPGLARERRLGEVDLRPIGRAVGLDMIVIGPERRRGGQHRQRLDGGAIGPKPEKMRQEVRIAGDEAAAQARGVRPLGERVHDDQVIEGAAQRRRGFEGARRGRVVIDLGVAFVDHEEEVVRAGEAQGFAR